MTNIPIDMSWNEDLSEVYEISRLGNVAVCQMNKSGAFWRISISLCLRVISNMLFTVNMNTSYENGNKRMKRGQTYDVFTGTYVNCSSHNDRYVPFRLFSYVNCSSH